MKKVALTLAGVLAAAAFAPEASALPVFARQTGAACSACHFQHFPLLNAFGRSFKASGYTQISQAQVEGEHLSIPANLNFGALVTAGYEDQSKAAGAVASNQNIFVPGTGGEMQLFWGGRINDFAGFLSEFGTAGAASAGSGKILMLPEITGDIRGGLVLYSIGQDAAGAFELLNTGATSIHRLMGNGGMGGQHIMAYSARQYVAAEAGATGAAAVVAHPNGFVNISRYINVGNGVAGGTNGVGLPFTYIRAAGIVDVAGFETGFGIQNWSGKASALAGAATEKATVIDAQMQGEVAGMPLGLYASYGTAGADAINPNNFNLGIATRSSFNIAAELGVLPGHATVQAAIRSGKNGAGAGVDGDNAFMIGATYELSMNQELTLHYTTQSGSAWNANPIGKNAVTLLLETLF
ncbi:cytochrome c1 signal peptide protein [Ferriphaselus amnicola]|uniref:Cytochrome c1 signal peptide protein n=1 Tax=Ferriphaselus amnicola TaxID=1188319 RepID=A0A2Z6G9F2_9PROT|nr:hypothetical protein [Ferriphaselus amnicola]BBE50151.1 cytochrome c1 signal peptide protein [Ferriphaselus amnicola]